MGPKVHEVRVQATTSDWDEVERWATDIAVQLTLQSGLPSGDLAGLKVAGRDWNPERGR